jgi:hypothetical protein
MKKKKLYAVCNVSNDLDFYLPFSVDINTSKAFNFCTVLQFKNFSSTAALQPCSGLGLPYSFHDG